MSKPAMDTVSDKASVTANAIDTGQDWQRLSPISILYFTASNIKKLAQFLIYVIPAVAVTANVVDLGESPYAIPVGLALLISLSVSGIVSYFFYHFRVCDQHVEVKDGVFNRRHMNLPFWRIQNVKIEQPIYYRPMQFALVVLDTAGSAKEEAKIVAVPLTYAQALRKQILAYHTGDPSVSSSAADNIEQEKAEDDEEVLNRRNIRDLIIHGITNNRVWIILGAAAPFYDSISDFAFNWLNARGLNLDQLIGEQTAAWWQIGLYTVTLLMIIMALLALLSVGGALLTFYDYTLSRHGDRYIRRSGLLNKQEVSMRQSRIQMITAKQDWLDKILGRVNLYFEQNTSGTQQQQAELMSPNKLLVPSVTIAETEALVKEAMPGSQLYQIPYQPVSLRYLWHWLGVWVWPPTIIIIGIYLYNQVWELAIGTGFLAIALSLILVLRWWRWGYAADNDYVYVRSGRIGLDYQCFEKYKVQQVKVSQSILMKKRKVATLNVLLASGNISIPYLPEQDAWTLANELLYVAEKSRRSWM
ncbi:PH domain-containing protein [Alteromonas sp. H39]|uniref:PH domain-containing protein n=1 Tax=Alteromonas sp. H39 TaxID=3389876 RepID=UPI0039E041FF